MKYLQAILPLLAVIFLFNTGSAQGGYVKLGDIKGESTDNAHRDWVIIESINQGMSQPGGGATGQSRRRGSVVFEDLVIQKKLDKSSPKLMEFCAKGQVIPEVIIDLVSSARNSFYKITLSNVMVTSINNNANCSQGCEGFESFSLNYEKISWEYTNNRGEKTTSSWNVGTGTR